MKTNKILLVFAVLLLCVITSKAQPQQKVSRQELSGEILLSAEKLGLVEGVPSLGFFVDLNHDGVYESRLYCFWKRDSVSLESLKVVLKSDMKASKMSFSYYMSSGKIIPIKAYKLRELDYPLFDRRKN